MRVSSERVAVACTRSFSRVLRMKMINIQLTFPAGESLVAGYINIPPYFNVLWTSATMEPIYRAL